MPRSANPLANSTIPDLSDTDSSACATGADMRSDELVLDELGPQRVAVQPEHVGGLRLIAPGTRHDRRKQRALDVADHHVVHAGWRFPIEALEIFVERFVDTAADLVAAVDFMFSGHAARASPTQCLSIVATTAPSAPPSL